METTINLLSPVSVGLVCLLAVAVLVLSILARTLFGPPAGLARRWGLLLTRALVLLTLLAVLANPVRVDRSPGTVERPKVVYLLDTSASMALGEGTSRFDEAVGTIRAADRLLAAQSRPELKLYRFGSSFSAIQPGPGNSPDSGLSALDSIAPGDGDTQLLAALRGLTGRFSRSRPGSVVLFSDGRAREPVGLEEMSRRYARMDVPVHVVPAGRLGRGGDVAVVSMVVPSRVRKHSRVSARVLVRSYGYDGRRAELELSAVGADGSASSRLNRLPIMLASGVQTFDLTFQSDLQTTRVRASVPLQPDEVSAENNAAESEVAVDRTKIRVLYVEGNRQPAVQPQPQPQQQPQQQGQQQARQQVQQQLEQRPQRPGRPPGAFSYFVEALSQDPDIECSILLAAAVPGRLQPVSGGLVGFPDTSAKLFAYDAIVLSNAGRESFSEEQLKSIDEWISRRGGGLCMAGGPRSFASGGWRGSLVGNMLPVALSPAGNDWVSAGRLTLRPTPAGSLHPIWHIVGDRTQNEAILKSLPDFYGGNRNLHTKPNAEDLAAAQGTSPAGGPPAVIAAGPYGKGRTMAITTAITGQTAARFAAGWGTGDNRYYAKFCRNLVYWLTENSVNGRRRLIAQTDKISYRPAEKIKLQAAAYDEGANRTTDCRVAVIIEPQSAAAELDSDYSPVHWPAGVQRTSGEDGPYVAWGEEFEMIVRPGQEDFAVELPIAESLAGVSAMQSLRIELSAYEDYALVDSTSIDVQILDDPFEGRNPLPDPELLGRMASLSGGRVLGDAASLAEMIEQVPKKVGPEEIRKEPLWSRWWLISLLLVLLTIEWAWRRSVGLA